jgi:hypothetical protein
MMLARDGAGKTGTGRVFAELTGAQEGGALGSHRTGEARLPWQSGVTERTGYSASAVPFSTGMNTGTA